MLAYLFLDIICSSKLLVLLELNSRITIADNVRGQISEHVFEPNGGYCLYISRRKTPEFPQLIKGYLSQEQVALL